MMNEQLVVLGVESSCDETAVAVVIADGSSASATRRILANGVASQIDVHARYGGVVPELASRSHVLDIVETARCALTTAEMTLEQIDGIAVVAGPGLVGSLLVGVEFAKGLAWALDRPLIGVNHIEAHLMAPLIEYDGDPQLSGTPDFPFVGLVVSGGHTHLYLTRGVGEYELLGATRDDAAGEAFDKVAKMLGLSYPGGAIIDRLARDGDPAAIRFPRAMMKKGNLEFSFSGLKTSVLTWLKRRDNVIPEGNELADVCASFQEAVVDVLVKKTFAAAQMHDVADIVISGGVSANSRLRARALEVATSAGRTVHVPPLSLCTDNAAMVAGLGSLYLGPLKGTGFAAHGLGASARLPMGRAWLDDPRRKDARTLPPA